jgi:hypothetical protein
VQVAGRLAGGSSLRRRQREVTTTTTSPSTARSRLRVDKTTKSRTAQAVVEQGFVNLQKRVTPRRDTGRPEAVPLEPQVSSSRTLTGEPPLSRARSARTGKPTFPLFDSFTLMSFPECLVGVDMFPHLFGLLLHLYA